MTTYPSLGPMGEVTCVSGQTFCRSGASGQIRPGGDQGIYIQDTRMVSTLLLRVNGVDPTPLGGYPTGRGAARFSACTMVNGNNDPALLIERRRVMTDAFAEHVRITNHTVESLQIVVELHAETDFAYVFDVKNGRRLPAARSTPVSTGLRFEGGTDVQDGGLRAEPRPHRVEPGLLSWTLNLPAQGRWELQLNVGVWEERHPRTGAEMSSTAAGAPHTGPQELGQLRVECSDEDFSNLVTQGVLDLDSLVVRDGGNRFFAAGTPWFLTLFGRDSLWAARMSLPLGTEIAGETLRVLASYQGTTADPVTEEAPGKIIHEIRHGALVDRGDLPPLYYGTVDATPLFVVVLEKAWRWGLPPADVEALLPHAVRALEWLRDEGDPGGDGFVRYRAEGERRLANQGWKDSGDAIFFAGGALAEPPIALCEVQGYAYQAAMAGAALLDAFGWSGGEDWRGWAQRLRERFRQSFWVPRDGAPFPAIALDGRNLLVDTVSSNIGHLPGTGILDGQECGVVADVLGAPDMDCGWGLRTVTSASPRFNPLSYHGGSVWPHDSAIAVDGLAEVGGSAAATALLQGLVAAGASFDYRLPELYGGEQRAPGSQPLPYPSACRPQAWAAGSALLLLRAVLGIEPDVPAGVIHIRPLRPPPFRYLSATGMSVGGGCLSLVLEDGSVTVTQAPEGLEVIVSEPPA